MISGILLVDKPAGMTSFKVVSIVKRLFNTKKVGHTGTLDPMATGLLPMLLNKATKVQELLQSSEKEYLASFKLGISTDTLDITGKIVKKTDDFKVNKDQLEDVLKSFEGFIEQVPPMYSAISKNGVRLYTLARKGIEIDREKRKVQIKKIKLLSYIDEDHEATILVNCSKGTYIRSLCADIGDRLLTGATLTKLRRTKTCGFTVENSLGLKDLEDLKGKKALHTAVIALDRLFLSYVPIFLNKNLEKVFLNGGKISFDFRIESGMIRVYNNCKEFLGLGEYIKERRVLFPSKVFYSR